MKLETEFYKLPLCYDVDRLVEEVTGFAEEEWRPHPQAYEGNSAMILVSAHGDQNDDMQGPMMPTDKLARCPYIQQVLASLDTVIGRSRLMRLGPEAKVPEHSDIHYYWYNHLRVHIPIITDPSIRFCCNGQEVNMAAGEAWTFNNWRQHTVINPSGVTRIHLVADTTGSAVFWDLLQRAERPFDPENSVQSEPELIPYSPDATADFPTERVNAPVVMHPGELDLLLGELRADLGAAESVPDEATKQFFEVLDRLRRDWRCAWAVYAEDEQGWPQYRSLIQRALDQAERVDGDLPMASNGTPAKNVLNSTLGAALNPGLKPSQADPTAATVAAPAAQAGRPAFERPVFIVAAPRSGSTLLFETMARNRGLWTIGGESHQEFEAIPGLNPASSVYHSNRLTEADADPAIAATLMDAFAAKLQHADGNQLHQYPQEQRPTAIRFLEKTPKNALRIPFLRAVFPDALFVFFHRNPRDNISSIIDAWGSGRFVTYPKLSGWTGPPWSLLLPPGWRELNGASIEKIAAFQWRCANQQILDDLADLPNQCWFPAGYEEFLADPQAQARRLCDFIDVPFGARMQAVTSGKLPNSRYTLTPPDPEKWRKNEKEVTAVLPELEELAAQLRSLGG